MRLDEMDLALERDVFLRSLIRELSGVLEMSSAKRSFGIFQRTRLGLPLVNQIVSAHRGTVVISASRERNNI